MNCNCNELKMFDENSKNCQQCYSCVVLQLCLVLWHSRRSCLCRVMYSQHRVTTVVDMF